MNKPIMLAIFLFTANHLCAMEGPSGAEGQSGKQEQTDDEGSDVSRIASACGFWTHIGTVGAEALQLMKSSNRWSGVERDLKSIVGGLIKNLQIQDAQQFDCEEDTDASAQAESGKDELNEEVEQLRERLKATERKLQELSDEKFARELHGQLNQEQ